MSADDSSQHSKTPNPTLRRGSPDAPPSHPSAPLRGQSQGFELELAEDDEAPPTAPKARSKAYPVWAGVVLALLIGLGGCGEAAPTPTAETAGGELLAAAKTRAAQSTGVAPAELAPQATLATAPGAVGETIGRVRIPALNIDAPVVEVTWRLAQVEGQTLAEWDTAQGAAGHHRGTAGFDGAGNCVLSGHASAENGVFQGLWNLQPGDAVHLVAADGASSSYRVAEVHKVQETGVDLAQRHTHAAWMAPTDDARLTLITCWPEWAYTHRVVVVARPG